MIYCHRNLLWCFQNGWLMVLIFFPDYIDNPRGKKQPQRSSLGLNYGPITSSMDDKIGGRRPRRPNFTQGEMNEWLFHSEEKLDVYLILLEKYFEKTAIVHIVNTLISRIFFAKKRQFFHNTVYPWTFTV